MVVQAVGVPPLPVGTGLKEAKEAIVAHHQAGNWRPVAGPANWYRIEVPPEWDVVHHSGSLTLQPPDRSLQVRIRVFWHPDDGPNANGLLDPLAMFPGSVRMRVVAPLPIGTSGIGIEGYLPAVAGGSWVRRLLRGADQRKWTVWAVRREALCLICSIVHLRPGPVGHETEPTARQIVRSLQLARVPAQPPQVFADRILAEAQQNFPDQQCRRQGGLQLHVGDARINLLNFYRAYRRQPESLEATIETVCSTIRRLLDWDDERLEPALENVRDRVMPMLVSEKVWRHALTDFVSSPWVAGLVIMYVVDEDDAYWYIREELLERWDTSLDDLHHLALANLDEYFEDQLAEMTAVPGETGLRMLMPTDPDAYNSVRLLNEPFHRKLQKMLGTEFVVGIPNRDFFVAVSLKNDDTLRRVRHKVASDYRTMDHPLTDRMLLVSTDGVSEYCD